jgi:1-pyrroline-5-carboxylate dehydrogenase
VDKITFTGSTEVGKEIMREAAAGVKKVTLELGGKSPNIVFADADLDAAVRGAYNGIFYGKGEVCAAGSRLLVERSVHDEFLAKLVERTRKLVPGDPLDPKTRLGPLINERQMKTVLGYVETGVAEGAALAVGGKRQPVNGKGYFVQPTVLSGVHNRMRVAQEEIFGPVLAVIRAKDFDDALHIANDTDYGLTGGVYSKDAAKIERAKKEFFVGNLYVNRKCTGALVGAHPFGGFNMSGTDSKAGGRDYLLLFLQGQSIAEKVGA